MALEDLARFLARKRPEKALSILRCFYMEVGGLTKEDLMRCTGIRLKALEYYMTRMRYWRILHTKRRHNAQALYYLVPQAFHARIDSLLCDPLARLVSDDLLTRERKAMEVRG